MTFKKYKFIEYHSSFPKLFEKEKKKIIKLLPRAEIEHVGSTSVPGLGGKGIIDIAIKASKNKSKQFINKLNKLGYKQTSNHPGTDKSIFLQKIIKSGGKERRIHLHLALTRRFWDSFITFRDYLRTHDKERDEYAKIKKEGAKHAKGDGKKYRDYKVKLIRKIQEKAWKG